MAEKYASALATGGGTGTELSPYTFAELIAYINASFVNGDKAYLKNDGIYVTAPYTITKACTLASPCYFEGYNTVIGDGGQVTIQRTGGGAVVFATHNTAYWIHKNIIFDANSLGTNAVFGSASSIFINCNFKRAGAGGINQPGVAFYCKAELNTSYGFYNGTITNCIAVNNGTVGIYDSHAVNCVSANNGGYGVQISVTGISIRYCVINYNNGGGITTSASVVTIINNIISNHAAGFGINFTAGGVCFAYNNNFYNTAVLSNVLNNLINSSIVNPDFVNPVIFDFRRNSNVIAGQGLSDINGVNYETTAGISPWKANSGVLPTFAGITGLVSNAEGTLLVSWVLGANVDYYDIYIQANTATGLFVAGNKCLSVDNTKNQAIIKTLGNGLTLLDYNTTYYVGVRANNAYAQETNIISFSAIPNNNVNVTIPLIPDGIWDKLLTGIITTGSIGKLIKDNLDHTISSRATQSSVTNIQTVVDIIKKIESNRWKIDDVAKTMIFYDDNGTTPLLTFNLKDKTGSPTTENPFERVPV